MMLAVTAQIDQSSWAASALKDKGFRAARETAGVLGARTARSWRVGRNPHGLAPSQRNVVVEIFCRSRHLLATAGRNFDPQLEQELWFKFNVEDVWSTAILVARNTATTWMLGQTAVATADLGAEVGLHAQLLQSKVGGSR